MLLSVVLVLAVIGCRVSGRPMDEPKTADPPKEKAEFKLTDDEQAVLDATNAERKKAKLDPLTADPKLTEAARSHAANMAKQSKLAHTLDDQTFEDRAKAAGYRYRALAENIAWNQPKPADAVASWMSSQGHKDNLLNGEYTHVGVAVAKNAKGEPYWVQVFGAPRERR
jgi:uncharacterized protein YkwD